jgi:hypothetical protein
MRLCAVFAAAGAATVVEMTFSIRPIAVEANGQELQLRG